jgi:hypothetical protein
MRITGADVLKLLGALSAIVAIAGGTWALVEKLQPEPPAASVQFVLDTSSEMQKPLADGTTKLAAARRAILREVRQRPNLAYSLRLAGGVCAAAGGEPAVRLERRSEDENSDVFRDALRGLGASGKSNFANGIARATSDLVDVESRSKSVIAFVGGTDACSPNAAEIIENSIGSLAGEDIAVQVRLLALDAPREERRALRRLTRRLENTVTANVSDVETEEDMQMQLSAELDEAETETTPTETDGTTTDTGATETGGTETTPTDTGATTGTGDTTTGTTPTGR